MHLSTPLADMELAERRDARTYSRAMLLEGGPISPEGAALVEVLVVEVISPHQASQGQLRPSSVRKYHEVTGPFLADLLFAASVGVWSNRETNTNALTGIPGGAKAFKTMRKAFGIAKLIEELPGYLRSFDISGEGHIKAARTSFRPTPKVMALVERIGIALPDLSTHFTVGRAPEPEPSAILEKRAAKVSTGAAPKRLPIEPTDPKAAQIVSQMVKLNGHLMEEGRIEGIAFAGLRRVFNNGDRMGFNWQWHGRFYSMPTGDSYENMEGGGATRCRVIRIDGEKVEEVDVSAAHLTILHGLLELPFDDSRDPYEIFDYGAKPLPGRTPSGRIKSFDLPPATLVDREQVKAWLLIALGASDSAVGGPKHNKARRGALLRYPFLGNLQHLRIGTLDLQYHEAEIMRLAMDELMEDHGIGFLPVHDALMVAKSNVDLAKQAIKNGFRRHFRETLGMASAPAPLLRP